MEYIEFEDFSLEVRPYLKEVIDELRRAVLLPTLRKQEEYVGAFESEFSSYNGSLLAIGVNSGTTALELALQASGVSAADEVILPSYTYIATALAVSNVGARPIFADIKEDTLTIDPGQIKNNITNRTKAIITVHMHGNPCDMDAIAKIAREYKLALIEDASHAHGATYKGKKVGNFGIGCFSCFINKPFGSYGNAGIITVNNKDIYERINRLICVCDNPAGALSQRTPCKIGILETAVLKAKLPFLERAISQKISIAEQYRKSLPPFIRTQAQEERGRNVYRDFVIIAPARNSVYAYLQKKNIGAKIRYPIPVHKTAYYKNINKGGTRLPITEKTAESHICLPISASLKPLQVSYICATLNLLAKCRKTIT